MTSPLACMMCTIDPQTTSLLLPMAQATVIAVPFYFRRNIAAAIRRARGMALDDGGPEHDDDLVANADLRDDDVEADRPD